MKKRNNIIISAIASVIAQCVGTVINLEFVIPMILPYGWGITCIGVCIIPFLLFMVVYLPLITIYTKKE